ncbi:MAG: hypothetical protein JXN65_10240 [Clostridia bacterium]|nr:hypothetical protein [Clostridia bacterium]
MSTELAVAIVAAVPTIAGIWTGLLTNAGNRKLKNIEIDMSVCKEASFASLQAHVEAGANGEVKKAYERLKENVFK